MSLNNVLIPRKCTLQEKILNYEGIVIEVFVTTFTVPENVGLESCVSIRKDGVR